MIFEIPLSPEPQTFAIQLGDKNYRLTFTYRNGWVMDIADNSGMSLVIGTALVAGIDLLEQFHHLGIQGQMFIDSDPTFSGLGVDSHLYFEPL